MLDARYWIIGIWNWELGIKTSEASGKYSGGINLAWGGFL